MIRIAKNEHTDQIVENLRGSAELIELDVSDTAFTDVCMKFVKEIPGLKTLNLARTALSDDGLEHLKDLLKLEWPSLRECDGITDTGLMLLKQLPNLKCPALWVVPR